MLILSTFSSFPEKSYSKYANRENNFHEIRENLSTAKISPAKLTHFDLSNRENLFRKNLYP